MSFRALLFSRNPETNAALTTACTSADIRAEICNDIFTAIKKVTQQSYSCVLADWSDQPDAGFLLKRARESGANQGVVAIGVVEKEPTATEMRDHHLDFLIFRPIAPEEAQNVLARATQRMQPASEESLPAESAIPYEQPLDAGASTAFVSSRQRLEPPPAEHVEPELIQQEALDAGPEPEFETAEQRPGAGTPIFQRICAAMVIFATVFVLWTTRDSIGYLAHTPEGAVNVLRESVMSLFYVPPTDPMPVHVPGAHAQEAVYVDNSKSEAPAPQIGVAESEADLRESHIELRKAADFPLPTPDVRHPDPQSAHPRTVVPESLRGSAPITSPVIVSSNPAQMLPVSAPMSPPVSSQSFSEPVPVSEEVARALLIQSVNPEYPPEGLAQKLHGPVVLQAIIGRDGHIEDLKIIRGYFVLGKAAIAAVKQWRFQPYSINGRPAQTQTVITIDFKNPTS